MATIPTYSQEYSDRVAQDNLTSALSGVSTNQTGNTSSAYTQPSGPVQAPALAPAPSAPSAPSGGVAEVPTAPPTPTIGEQLSGIKAEALRIQDLLPGATQESLYAPPTYTPGPEVDPFDYEEEKKKSYQQQLQLHQAEIDATNQVYDQLLNEARLQGQGRLGSVAFGAANRGMVGTGVQRSQLTQQEQANTARQRAIQAERTAAIGNILGVVNTAALSELKEKRAARDAGVDEHLAFLSNKDERKADYATNLAADMLAKGIDISQFSEDELNEYGKAAGLKAADIIAAYTREKSSQEAAGGQFTLGPEDKRFDSRGNLIASGEPKSSDGKIYSTSRGLVRIGANGEPELIFGSGDSGSNGPVSFTSSEKKKLEQAGLLQASRQAQLDFLYQDGSDGYNTAINVVGDNPTASDQELKAELLNPANNYNLNTTEVNAILADRPRQLPLDEAMSTTIVTKLYGPKLDKNGKKTGYKDYSYDQVLNYINKGEVSSKGKTYTLTEDQKALLIKELDNQQGFFQGVFSGGK